MVKSKIGVEVRITINGNGRADGLVRLGGPSPSLASDFFLLPLTIPTMSLKSSLHTSAKSRKGARKISKAIPLPVLPRPRTPAQDDTDHEDEDEDGKEQNVVEVDGEDIEDEIDSNVDDDDGVSSKKRRSVKIERAVHITITISQHFF
jgi:hypothetical protein